VAEAAEFPLEELRKANCRPILEVRADHPHPDGSRSLRAQSEERSRTSEGRDGRGWTTRRALEIPWSVGRAIGVVAAPPMCERIRHNCFVDDNGSLCP
jgi:hypothetical protein